MDHETSSPESPSPSRTEDRHPVVSAQQARQAVKLGTMRYALGVSLGLAVVVMLVAYFLFVVFHR
jgi:hypothetical protein